MQKEVKKALRTNKRAYIDALATKAEEAANRGEQGKLYEITKAVSGRKRPSPNFPVKDKKGQLLSREKEMEDSYMDQAF